MGHPGREPGMQGASFRPSCLLSWQQMSGELERLAYEVSLKALERQENVVDELRSRTGTLLAASSLSASFLGARALDHPGATWLGLIALSLFGVSVGSAIYVLLPRTELILALKGSRIFTPDLGGQGLAETYRRLTYWIEAFLERNESSIDRLFIFFRIAAGSSLAGAILWSVQLVS
jgi:hypothetical protein